MARRSRGAAATAVAPVPRATRSRTRLQAAEALAAELNASRASCEPNLDSTASPEMSLVDDRNSQLNCEESSSSIRSITTTPVPEINDLNEDISLDIPSESSLPAAENDEQYSEGDEKGKFEEEVKIVLDETINEVVKAQRLPNIDPATTSVQSHVRVRGVYHTKGFLDAKISMYQEYLEKHAPDQLNLPIEPHRSPVDKAVKKYFNELQKITPVKDDCGNSSIDRSASSTPIPSQEVYSLSSEEVSVDNKVSKASVSDPLIPQDNKEDILLTSPLKIEASEVTTSKSLEILGEAATSMEQSAMKEESPSPELTVPILDSTEIAPKNLSCYLETRYTEVKGESPEIESEETNQVIETQLKVSTTNLSADVSLSVETTNDARLTLTDSLQIPQKPEEAIVRPQYAQVKQECPEIESSIEAHSLNQTLQIEPVQQTIVKEVVPSEFVPDTEQAQVSLMLLNETIDNSDSGMIVETSRTTEENPVDAVQDQTVPSAILTEQATPHTPESIAPEIPSMDLTTENETHLNTNEISKSESVETNVNDLAGNMVQSLATNQTTSTANMVPSSFYHDPNLDITGAQEMDMEVSDDSREASVEPIPNEKPNTSAADVLPTPPLPEVRPPPPPVVNEVPPPPTEESYADDFYFPPPPAMPPNMDLTQFYMSLHAGDFGTEYTQQLTQYISESVHKWYQIHQYYSFNRVPLPRIDRYKAFMDHYDAFQRVQYTAVMRPNAEAQKLSEERSRNRIQGVLKSLVRDKKKKESAAEKSEEILPSVEEPSAKSIIPLGKPEMEIIPPVMNRCADPVVVSSSNEPFKKATLPPPQVIHSPKIAHTEKEPTPSVLISEPEADESRDVPEQKKEVPVASLEPTGISSHVSSSQPKINADRSRSRTPKRKRSYSRSRSRSRTRSRSRSRYRSKTRSRSRSRSRSYGRSRSRSYSRSRTPHSRSRSRSRRRGRSRSRSRSPRRYRSRSPRGYRQKSPRRWQRGYRSFRNNRGGYRRSSRSPWSDRRNHYKGGYGGFNDRYKKRNYSRSPVREPHSQNEDTNPVEEVVESVVEEQLKKDVEVHGGDVVVEEPPFPRFEEIETLIYMDEKISKNGKKRRLETDLDCDCRKNELDCSDNRCINREMMFECSSKCGPQCKNRRFALRQYANVKPFYTGPNKGWGVRAMEIIPKGTFIIEYIGEVVTNEEFASRQKRYAKDPNHTHHYIFELGQKLIDATVKGNSSRFINHSCDPNAICLKWAVPKTPRDVSRIGFFAKSDIAIGDEITFDYQFCNYGRTAQSCHCGSVNCKGVIGKKPDLGDFDDEEVYDEDSEEFDDVEEPEEEKEREQLRIEKEEQLEAKAIFYLNTIHSEGYYGRKQLAKNSARFVKYLANVLTTENRIRMQSLIERADSEFYQTMKKNNLFNILLEWVSTSGWERHDLDLKIGVLRMIEEKDKDNFIEKAVGWNQENFPILCELAKGVLPDDIACVDTLEQVVEKVCGDDPEAEGDGNLASYTGVVFNEMTEIALRLAGDENIKKGVETTGLKVFKIPKKIREKTVEHKEPIPERMDLNREKYDQRSNFRAGFPSFNGKREFDRGIKRRFDDRYRRDDEKVLNKDVNYGRTDYKRTRRSRFDQSPVHSPLAIALNTDGSSHTDSPAMGMSMDSAMSPNKAVMKNMFSAAQSSAQSTSFDSYHQNMAAWQSYMSMGGYPAPYPMMAFSAQKSNLSDSEKKIGYYMSMRLEQLKHFRTSYEMEIKYLEVAIKKKEAEAALAKAHQEAAAAAAAAAALASEATRNEPDSLHSSQSAPPPPPERRRSTYARALDADGTVYYYHKETRATCWELPEGEHCDENDAVPYTQTQQPDSSMKEDEEPKCQMDIAARAIEIFSSPPGVTEMKVEEVPQPTGSVEILNDLPEDEKQKRIRVFKLTVEREVKPIIDSFLKGIPSADANRRLWLIKQVAKEMYKRESSKPESDLKFNDVIRKKVHNYTKAFMHRKCSDGAKDLWKGFEVFS